MQNSPYFKSLLFFPLIIQCIGTAVLPFLDDGSDVSLSTVEMIKFAAISTFIVLTIPAFLIVLWAKSHRYARYNVKAIALVSVLIGFCYNAVVGFINSLIVDIGFGVWLRAGGLSIAILMCCVIALSAVMILPLLLPKEK